MERKDNERIRILLAEDEPTLAMIISETLGEEGLEVDVASDGGEGLRKFQNGEYSLVVADVMMPGMDGFEMTRRLRDRDPDIPLIFLTAKSDISDIVKGFEAGANDYLTKPFKMLELIVRIKALLRRYRPGQKDVADKVYRVGGYEFNYSMQILSRGDEKQPLTHFESELLHVLILGKGSTVRYSELMEELWDRDDTYNRNSLHGFIHKLRGYLSDDPDIQIVNNRGVGYKLTCR